MTSQNIWVWLHIFKVWRDLSKQSLSVPPRFRQVFRWIGTAENKGYFDGSGKLFNGFFLYNDWIIWKNGMSIFIRDNF